MAVHALPANGPAGDVHVFETGRQVPNAPLRIPTDRRLKQMPGATGDIRYAASSRTDGEVNFDSALKDRLALGVRTCLTLDDLCSIAFNAKRRTNGLKRIAAFCVVRLLGRQRCNRRHRVAHGMALKRVDDVEMTFRTRRRAHILHMRMNIAKGTSIGETWIGSNRGRRFRRAGNLLVPRRSREPVTGRNASQGQRTESNRKRTLGEHWIAIRRQWLAVVSDPSQFHADGEDLRASETDEAALGRSSGKVTVVE